MAYVSKELKAKAVAAVKPLLKKYGVKGTFSVRNHSDLVLTISEGVLDFNLGVRTHETVNHYWLDTNYSGETLKFLQEAIAGLRTDEYYNNSDSQSDYFSVSHYISINIGSWNKPYKKL